MSLTQFLALFRRQLDSVNFILPSLSLLARSSAGRADVVEDAMLTMMPAMMRKVVTQVAEMAEDPKEVAALVVITFHWIQIFAPELNFLFVSVDCANGA